MIKRIGQGLLDRLNTHCVQQTVDYISEEQVQQDDKCVKHKTTVDASK